MRSLSLVGASMARHVKALARGEDDRAVEHDRASRSISRSAPTPTDLRDAKEIDHGAPRAAQGVAQELRREKARGAHRAPQGSHRDFTTWTRAKTLPEPTDLAEPIVGAAR
jgi:DNA polymerase-4